MVELLFILSILAWTGGILYRIRAVDAVRQCAGNIRGVGVRDGAEDMDGSTGEYESRLCPCRSRPVCCATKLALGTPSEPVVGVHYSAVNIINNDTGHLFPLER